MPATHPEQGHDVETAAAGDTVVHRVGFRPDPVAWTPWQYTERARFDGRWDDDNGRFRTVCIAESLLGCLLEVLSRFRSDPELAAEVDIVVVGPSDEQQFPTVRPDQVPTAWLEPRCAGVVLLTGSFIDVRSPGRSLPGRITNLRAPRLVASGPGTATR